MQKASICITKNSILQGGKACKNPTITWTGSAESCLIVNCEEDNCIRVQIPEGCDEKCITFIVECDDCDECPPQIITRCLCEDGECPPCFECVDGFCQPKPCPDGKFCDPDTGDCVECVDNENCPCNQVCVQGECGCPPGTIEHPVTQCCVECITSNDCEGCDICISGDCTPKDCTGGVLNPNTCNCQECLIKADCDDPNECCVNGICVCCPGFRRNPQTGECEPIPPCISDDDCPDCFVCSPDGCIPLVCPDGRVCVDGVCEIECDCPSGSCPPGRACTEIRPGVCVCVPVTTICSGPCDTTSDCNDPRCGCVDNECVFVGPPPPGPCDGPCSDGNDCAPGCGCFEGQCVPCTSVSCANGFVDCPDGCVCNGGVCAENPCAEVYCQNSNDCGQGCGCDQSLGQCVPCSSLSCAGTDCADVEGCSCNGFSCEDDGSDPEDPSNCEDEFYFEKGSCDLDLVMQTEDCCQCEQMSIRQNLSVTSANANSDNYVIENIKWFKDGVYLDDLPDLLNEYPTQHSVQYRVIDTYTQTNSIGAVTGGSQTIIMETVTVTADLNPASVAFAILPKPNITTGSSFDVRVPFTFARLSTRVIEIRTNQDFLFRNECRYSIRLWSNLVSYNNSSSIPSGAFTGPTINSPMQRLQICRTPLFNVFRNFNAPASTNGTPLLSVYANNNGGGSYSYLMTPDLSVDIPNGGNTRVVQYGAYYAATSDCGCDKNTVYSCQGDGGVATPLVYCDPRPIIKDVDYEITNCGETLTFLRDVPATCEVYTAEGNTKPIYILRLNGQLVDTRTLGVNPSIGNNVYLTGNSFTLGSGIKLSSVRFEIAKDFCQECNLTTPLPFQPLQVNFETDASCSSASSVQFTVGISGGQAPYSIAVTRDGSPLFTDTRNSAGVFTYNETFANGTYVLTVTDSQGCIEQRTVIVNVGASLSNVTANLDCAGTQPTIMIMNGNTESITASIATDAPTEVFLQVSGNSVEVFNALPNTDYVVTLTGDQSECAAVFNLGGVNCCDNNPISNADVVYECPNGWVFQNVPVGAVVGVRDIASAGAFTTISQGDGAEPGNYTIQITYLGCSLTRYEGVPTCFECTEDDCIQANNNIGKFTNDPSCNNECGCQGEVCEEQYLYANDRIFSIRIDGVDYPTLTSATAFGCSSPDDEPTSMGLEALLQLIITILTDAGDCNAANVTLSLDCVLVSSIGVGSGCFPGSNYAARLTIRGATADIQGWSGTECYVPSTKNC